MRIQVTRTFFDALSPVAAMPGQCFIVSSEVGAILIAAGNAIDLDAEIAAIASPIIAVPAKRKRERAVRS